MSKNKYKCLSCGELWEYEELIVMEGKEFFGLACPVCYDFDLRLM